MADAKLSEERQAALLALAEGVRSVAEARDIIDREGLRAAPAQSADLAILLGLRGVSEQKLRLASAFARFHSFAAYGRVPVPGPGVPGRDHKGRVLTLTTSAWTGSAILAKTFHPVMSSQIAVLRRDER